MFRSRLFILVVVVCASCAGQTPEDPNTLLREADHLAWLTNWTAATPLFARAELIATDAGDQRNALYAKFGRLRGEMQIRSLPDVSAELARDLESGLAKDDARLRLRALTVKGDVDLEWDVQAAHDSWQEVLRLATELRHDGWVNRARGDLGMIAFLRGNSGEATALVGQALQVAAKSGDVGGQLRYLSAIGAGLLMAGDPRASLGYIEKALAVAQTHPEVGFPYPAHSTKILALLALKQPDQAEDLLRAAMEQATGGDRRIKQVELLMIAATIARARGQHDVSLSHIERAVQFAQAGGVQRLLADAEAERAAVFRTRGNLERALPSARAAVAASKAAGSRWTLPQQLEVQASIYAALGRTAEADRTYEEAADVLEGTMLNVPNATAQARLVGVMSDVYTGHFTLAAEQRDPRKAYEILERARGRALADVLRGSNQEESGDPQRQQAISHLQVRLMRALSEAERRSILDALWEAEDVVWRTRVSLRPATLERPAGVELAIVQQQLAPSETLLEYVLSEPRSYCLIITRTGIDLVLLPSAGEINSTAETFVSGIRKQSVGIAGRLLYEAVLRPVLSRTPGRQFIIVPDGQLHRVPFDAFSRSTKA